MHRKVTTVKKFIAETIHQDSRERENDSYECRIEQGQDGGAVQIARALQNECKAECYHTIKNWHFNFDGIPLSCRALETFLNALFNCAVNLEDISITLSESKLTDESAISIATALKAATKIPPRLHIVLAHNNITQKGGEALLTALTSLSAGSEKPTFDLSDNRINESLLNKIANYAAGKKPDHAAVTLSNTNFGGFTQPANLAQTKTEAATPPKTHLSLRAAS